MSTKSVQRNARRKLNKKARALLRTSFSKFDAANKLMAAKKLTASEATALINRISADNNAAAPTSPKAKVKPVQLSRTEIKSLIQPFMADGAKLRAVKAVKLKTGLGLKDALAVVKKLWGKR